MKNLNDSISLIVSLLTIIAVVFSIGNQIYKVATQYPIEKKLRKSNDKLKEYFIICTSWWLYLCLSIIFKLKFTEPWTSRDTLQSITLSILIYIIVILCYVGYRSNIKDYSKRVYIVNSKENQRYEFIKWIDKETVLLKEEDHYHSGVYIPFTFGNFTLDDKIFLEEKYDLDHKKRAIRYYNRLLRKGRIDTLEGIWGILSKLFLISSFAFAMISMSLGVVYFYSSQIQTFYMLWIGVPLGIIMMKYYFQRLEWISITKRRGKKRENKTKIDLTYFSFSLFSLLIMITGLIIFQMKQELMGTILIILGNCGMSLFLYLNIISVEKKRISEKGCLLRARLKDI